MPGVVAGLLDGHQEGGVLVRVLGVDQEPEALPDHQLVLHRGVPVVLAVGDVVEDDRAVAAGAVGDKAHLVIEEIDGDAVEVLVAEPGHEDEVVGDAITLAGELHHVHVDVEAVGQVADDEGGVLVEGGVLFIAPDLVLVKTRREVVLHEDVGHVVIPILIVLDHLARVFQAALIVVYLDPQVGIATGGVIGRGDEVVGEVLPIHVEDYRIVDDGGFGYDVEEAAHIHELGALYIIGLPVVAARGEVGEEGIAMVIALPSGGGLLLAKEGTIVMVHLDGDVADPTLMEMGPEDGIIGHAVIIHGHDPVGNIETGVTLGRSVHA